MALFWRLKWIGIKIETTYGTDSVPAAVDSVLAKDFELMPMEGEDEERNLDRPFMGAEPSIAVGLHAKFRFKVELQASGTAGTAPGWGPLMRACGCAQVVTAGTSVAYNPISTGFESVTAYVNVNGVRWALTGCRGSARLELEAEKVPHLVFEMTGLFAVPTDTAAPSPNYSAYQVPLAATTANTPTFTLGAYSPVLRKLTFDMGNQVEPRFLIRSNSIMIVDRRETIEFSAEAKTMATWNYLQAARDGTTVALTLQHGSVAGRRVTLAAPVFQYRRAPGFTQEQGIVMATVRGVPLPNAGNDQWTLTCT